MALSQQELDPLTANVANLTPAAADMARALAKIAVRRGFCYNVTAHDRRHYEPGRVAARARVTG